MRKTALVVAIAAGIVFGLASANDANAAPTKPTKPAVAYAAHGKTAQQAYWALSYNHPGVLVCVTKGDKSEAVYKIAKYAKAHRKLGYYWGGLAGAKFDKMCAR
jgi:hypothetical protein